MSDNDGEKIVPSSLDRKADEPVRHRVISEESYEDNNQGGRVARKPRFQDSSTNEPRSWAMAEIERVLANQARSGDRENLSRFAQGLTKRNDFTLRDFSRRLERQVRLQFANEIRGGKGVTPIREFDIQSQTMRMVTANAVLGSYQFQKNQVLPFMRKSLALGYKKVTLLKNIQSEISNLSRGSIAKLEAIKLNTGAAAPFKDSLLKRLKDAVAAKSMERVATNISNVIMDGYGEKYSKFVSPRLKRLHGIISTPGKHGGVNGVSNALSRKLNSLRRDTLRIGAQDPTGLTGVGRFKASAAKASSGILGGAVRLTQRLKLPGSTNGFVSNTVGDFTKKISKLSPFAATDVSALIQQQAEEAADGANSEQKLSTIAKILREWRVETKEHNQKLLGHISAIRHEVAPSRKVAALRRDRRGTPESPTHDRTTRPNGVRKNSYEDLQSRKKARGGFAGWSKRAKAMGAGIGTGALANIADGDDPKETLSNALKDNLSSAVEDKIADRATSGNNARRGGVSRMRRRANVAMRRAQRKGVGGVLKSGLKGMFKGGSRAAGATTRLGGRSLLSGGAAGAKGLFSMAKGPLGLAAVAGVGQYYWNKNTEGELQKKGNTLLSMASYGAMGAQIGALFGGIGAVPGAAVGAAVGGLVANADEVGKSLSRFGQVTSAAASGLWTGIFGQDAIVRWDGTVVQQEKSSILGDLRIALFGRKEKKSISGQTIATERSNLIGSINYGIQKLFFGDQYSNGQYKQGTSLIQQAKDGVNAGMKEFWRQIVNVPSDFKKDLSIGAGRVSKAANWAKKKIQKGADATGLYFTNQSDDIKNGSKSIGEKFSNFFSVMGEQDKGKMVGGLFNFLPSITSLTGFITGTSTAIIGWSNDSGYIDSPTSPYYGFVTEVLTVYGVKDRNQYKYLHSVELAQEQINKGLSKPFDDADMAYMAGRFGFDPKNPDAVNYFKLWYKRRFIPGMELISQALRPYKLDFASVLTADKRQLDYITVGVRKLMGSSSLGSLGLEPTTQAYNKYAKIGAGDPGGRTPGAVSTPNPYDPRDPNNRAMQNRGSQSGGFNNILNNEYKANNDNAGLGSYGPSPAQRKNANRANGNVTDQPEYKQALAKLPPNLKKIVGTSRALSFALWSTAVQNGPDNAAKIFQSTYTENMDKNAYLRSIYQNRSTKFGDLSEAERTEAMQRINKEMAFALEAASGKTMPSMDQMYQMGGQNVIDRSYIGGTAVTPGVKAAVPYAQESQRRYGVPTSISLAQYIVESGAGKHMPPNSNNPFGIKAVGDQPYVLARTKEQGPNGLYTTTAKFRRFGSMQEAFDQHARLLSGSKYYRRAMQYKNDPFQFAQALQGVYATDKDYAKKLINIMRSSNLMQYDVTGGSSTRTAPQQNSPAAAPTRQAAPQQAAAPQRQQAQPRPAPRRAAQPAAPAPRPYNAKDHDMSEWTAALRENTAAVRAGQGPVKPGNTTVVAPTIVGGNRGGNSGFLAMSMRKAQAATGKQ